MKPEIPKKKSDPINVEFVYFPEKLTHFEMR
jgi:hypothetical protein